MKYGTFLLILFSVLTSYAPLQAQWATQVIEHQFGDKQRVGQSLEYFPNNILGPCDSQAGPSVPASNPKDICSLGRNGWVILGFEREIHNENGPDFVVFENAFLYGNGRVYDEWLEVAVSADGITWFTFPFDSTTGVGFAGRTPTKSGAFATQDWQEMGGDAFDLEGLGLSSIKYIRLTDATRFQTADRLSADLDAVRSLNSTNSTKERSFVEAQNPVKWCAGTHALEFETQSVQSFSIVSMTGETLVSEIQSEAQYLLSEHLTSGVYAVVYRLRNGNARSMKFMIY